MQKPVCKMARRSLRFATALALVLLLSLSVVQDGVAAKRTKKAGGSILSGKDKIAKLDKSKRDGLIQLDSQKYKDLVLKPDRPYHLFVMFTVQNEKYKCDLCHQLMPEYVVLGESFDAAKVDGINTRDGLDVYFAVVDFESAQNIFAIYGYTSAPHVVYVAPDRSQDLNEPVPTQIQVPTSDVYNAYTLGKKAEDMRAFVAQKTGFDFAIRRSMVFAYTLLAGVVVILAITARFVLLHFDFVLTKLRTKRLWMVVSLLFYGLSVSGMVYCIIREPPAFSFERGGKIRYFHPQGRSQFVVEGLIVGGLDVAAAGFAILMAQWAIYIKDDRLRNLAIAGCGLGFVVMYREMISCYQFKNQWYTGWMGF